MASHLPRTVLVAALLGACRSEPAPAPPKAEPSAKPPKPVDRLAPEELPPGEQALFGLTIPRAMKVQGKLGEVGLAWGDLPAEEVANYVRSRVDAEHVEIGAARTIFPAARIKGRTDDRSFRIEVVRESVGTRLIVQDLAPTPVPPPEPGLTDAERWRRAGFSPDGKPLNMKALE